MYQNKHTSAVTQEERDAIAAEFAQERPQDCQCGLAISSARQIACPGTDLCDRCAKGEEEGADAA